jgi:hypothetical protein
MQLCSPQAASRGAIAPAAPVPHPAPVPRPPWPPHLVQEVGPDVERRRHGVERDGLVGLEELGIGHEPRLAHVPASVGCEVHVVAHQVHEAGVRLRDGGGGWGPGGGWGFGGEGAAGSRQASRPGPPEGAPPPLQTQPPCNRPPAAARPPTLKKPEYLQS